MEETPVSPSRQPTLVQSSVPTVSVFHSQQVRTHTYQRLSRQLLTAPFIGLLLIILLVYSLFDIYQNSKSKLHYSTTVSALIAQSASSQRPELVKNQTEYALKNSPFIDSIVFYPISTAANIPTTPSTATFSLPTVFLEDELGISEPVSIVNYSDPESKQLIGYIHTTLNLKKVRNLWLSNNFPMVLLVFVAAGLMLLLVLRRIGQITRRLPPLENISQKIVENTSHALDESQATKYLSELAQLSPKPTQRVWVFEKALLQLLTAQRIQSHDITKLAQEYQQIQDKMAAQLVERSNFQNTLTHEFKLALNKMHAGINLLNNQYVSQEQKDALELIEAGHQDLTNKLNQIIHLQRIEKGQLGIQLEQINPTQLLAQIITPYQPIAAQKGLTLALQAQHTEYLLEGDRQKITAILSALVENAVKFTEKGSITITSQLVSLPHNVRWQIEVQDTGIGIAEKHLSHIFEPFFEVNPDNKGDLGGGRSLAEVDLSIAAKLTELLNGSLMVESELDVGSTFTLTLRLEEWRKHFERMQLKDKTVNLYHQNASFLPILEKISAAGAGVMAFTDATLLLANLTKTPTDALLFSPEVEYHDLLSVVEHIRQAETGHRALVVVYYTNDKLPNVEVLQAAGVDYFELYDPATQHYEQYIKRLMHLLN